MVRSPSFDSNGMKKGAWSEDEDYKLRAFIFTYGHSNWRLLPKYAGLKRCGKSCRLRWVNHLKPGVRRGNFSEEEEELITRLHAQLGNKWSTIASELPGRTDNDIKNFWHTRASRKRNPNTSAATQPPPPPPSTSMDDDHQTDAASLIKTHEFSILTAFDRNSSFTHPITQPQIGSCADYEFPADYYAQNYAALPPLPEGEFYYPQPYYDACVGCEDRSVMFGAVNGNIWDESFAANASDYQLQSRACAPFGEGSYDPVFSLWNS